MRFPRNAKVFRGHLDAAPFAGMFFCLLILLLLASLTYTPGVHIQLPAAANLPGLEHPSLAVAVDPAGRFYFRNQRVPADLLRSQLQLAVEKSAEPLTLVVQADKRVTYETLVSLTSLARQAGIKDALLATLPGAFDAVPAGQLPP
jgi:biopolymer transport protein ExbD